MNRNLKISDYHHKLLRYIKKKIYVIIIRRVFIIKYLLNKNKYNFHVISIEETIKDIIDKKISLSRFGDGEFRWIDKNPHNSFQDVDEKLSKELIKVIISESDKVGIAISPAFSDLNYANKLSKSYWQSTIGQFGDSWIKHLKKNKVYYNADISRIYIGNIDKNRATELFDHIKKLWDDKEILIVEGTESRLGVGNDLFSNSKSISRILAPQTNAYNKYKLIYNESIKHGHNKLILIALGPTATVLAYDLGMHGLWAVDIGHIDIEYEWYLIGAVKKVPIKGKYVNEASTNQDLNLSDKDLKKYNSQIVATIL